MTRNSRRIVWLVAHFMGFLLLIGCQPTSTMEKPAAPPSAAGSSSPPATPEKVETTTVAPAPDATEAGTPAAEEAAQTPASPVQPTSVPGTGTVLGRVTYKGELPKPKLVNFGAEKVCQAAHTTPPTEESLVVNKEGGLQWVLVRVSGRVRGDFPPPTEPVELDQKGCIFSPHVVALQAGQPLEFRNSDNLLHNVRCETKLNQAFNRNLPKAGDTAKVTFPIAEVGIKIKCDVHFWMAGYIHVIKHPFFAVSDADGKFTIVGLPPGKYKLEAWHEKLGKQSSAVTITADQVQTVEFTF
jgi:plastocyanin